MKKKPKYKFLIDYFTEEMPSPETELNYNSPFELICAVILSAQCTDKRVNLISPKLFSKYNSFNSLSKASEEEIKEIIKSCSYPNNKSKLLLNMAKKIVSEFSAELPRDMDNLLKIPGVGRKTANVLLSVLHKYPGFAVDTHVFRVANRIGLTKNSKNPEETEKTLTKNFPDSIIPDAHHWLILHGRYTCKARNPLCEKCGLQKICDYFKTNKIKKS